MKSYKDIGFTIRKTNYGEADVIMSVFTKYHGRVEAIAKGARKIKSRKGGNFDIMALSSFSFAKGKNLDIVTEVKLLNDYSSIQKKLNNTLVIFYVAKVLKKILQEGEYQKELFEITKSFLEVFEKEKEEVLIYAFELKLLGILGFSPNFEKCLACGTFLSEDYNWFVKQDAVGFYCDEEKSSGIAISHKTIKILKFFYLSSFDECLNVEIDTKTKKEIAGIMKRWINYMLEVDE